MDIIDAIFNIANKKIDSSNDWYYWRPVNEKNLYNKIGISLHNGNQYKKNVELKRVLHDKWKKSDKTEKYNIVKYYISDWGGIHGNSEASLVEYADSSPESLIGKGKDGIASWSKALCIYNPEKYAIFDARVSAAINAIQLIYSISDPVMYPILPSRNKTILSINRKYKKYFSKKKEDESFYHDYLSIIGAVSCKLTESSKNSYIYDVEMLLFSMAEELVEKVQT